MERNWKGKWAVTGTINDVLCQWRRVVNGKSREDREEEERTAARDWWTRRQIFFYWKMDFWRGFRTRNPPKYWNREDGREMPESHRTRAIQYQAPSFPAPRQGVKHHLIQFL